MRSQSRPADAPIHRISGPVELLGAVPYLLGFHPRASVVLVGLRDGRLVVTARLDLADAAAHGALEQVTSSITAGGADTLVGVVYPEDDAEEDWPAFARRLQVVAGEVRCAVAEVLLVRGDRWWSLTCDGPSCCPPEGRPLDARSTSVFAAAATYEGMVALPDRAAVGALLEPRPAAEREELAAPLAEEQRAATRAVLQGRAERRERGIKRALFAAARAAEPPAAVALTDADLVRYGVALTGKPFRDAVWVAVDDGRLDGRALWREMARRLPSPFDAPPLVLFGWSAWRAGECAVAGMAAERAVASDPRYVAADLLLAAVSSGLNPHTVPRLRLPA